MDREATGIVIVDHGSHRAESDRRHEAFVEEWRDRSLYSLVEAAHMELAEPSIRTAFDACAAAGATTVVIAPFFLWPGDHWSRDIPALAADASAGHPGVRYLVAAPSAPTTCSWTSWKTASSGASAMRRLKRPSAKCAPGLNVCRWL